MRLPLVASLATLATLATGATTAPAVHTIPTTHLDTSTKVELRTLAAGKAGDQIPSGGSGLSVSIGLAPFGGDPNECGTSASIEVNVGDQVNVCYTVTNNGTQTLAYQWLVDSVDGAVLAYDPTPIAPGQSDMGSTWATRSA